MGSIKKIAILSVISAITFAFGAERELRDLYKNTLKGSNSSCFYTKGSYVISKDSVDYHVPNGYLICRWRSDHVVLLFEHIVEEEGRETAITFGDFVLSPKKF